MVQHATFIFCLTYPWIPVVDVANNQRNYIRAVVEMRMGVQSLAQTFQRHLAQALQANQCRIYSPEKEQRVDPDPATSNLRVRIFMFNCNNNIISLLFIYGRG